MAQTPRMSVDDARLSDNAYPDTPWTLKRAPEQQPDLDCVDGASRLFTTYLKNSDAEDEKMANHWKADAEGVLIFAGLFSAAMSAFVVSSINDLRPNRLETAQAYYLENILPFVANATPSHAVTPRATVDAPTTFSVPKYAIWVNALWSLSLVQSLTCAVLATLIQQWARRYVEITQSRHAPHKRARIRSFFAEGVHKQHLPVVVEALPALIHSSVLLFFAGLAVLLYGTESTVFKVVATWVGTCTLLYACITFLPILRHDSPYLTPLSPTVWTLYNGFLCVIFQSLQWLTAFNCIRRTRWERFRALRDQRHKWYSQGLERAAKDFALALPSDFDGPALTWTLKTLDEDDEIEEFLEGIPGFCNSTVVSNPRAAFKTPNGEKISETLIGFMCHTLSSNLIPEPVKQRRMEICNKAVEAASLPINRRIFDRVLYKDWSGLLNSVEFGLFLGRIPYGDPFSDYYSQCVISVIIARVQERDSRWFELVVDHLDISEPVLRNYLGHGDSLLLANCVSICRRTMRAYSEHGWFRDVYSESKTLESVSKLDIQHTLPEVRNDFCALWNELVGSARRAEDRRTRSLSINILMHIRNIYITLHDSTRVVPVQLPSTPDIDPILSLPFSYPLCNLPTHSMDYPCEVDKMAASAIGLTARTCGAFPLAVLDDDSPGTRTPGSVPEASSVLPMNSGHIGTHVAGDPSPDHVITRLHAERPPCSNHPTYPAQVSACVYTPTPTSLGCTLAPRCNEDNTPSFVLGTVPPSPPLLPLSNTPPGHVEVEPYSFSIV